MTKINGKSKKIWLIALIFVFGLAGCSAPSPSPAEDTQDNVAAAAEYQRITAEEAYNMMAESDDFVLLDVRTEGEFSERHIEGAILIPNDQLRDRAASELPDKGQLILIYCRSGNRSASAARTLLEMGYTNVFDFGGINDWPYETVA